MNNFLKDFFHYNKNERNGAAVLVVLCVFLYFLPEITPFFIKKEKTDFSNIQAEVEAFASRFEEELPSENTSTPPKNLFYFDPNTISKEKLSELGLSSKLAQTIINYREKGGEFRKKKDLKKMYGLSETDYFRLAPFIQIEKEVKNSLSKSKSESTQIVELFPFNPNTASEETLNQLGLSKRVINTLLKFRNKGGSFRKEKDFAKIYGLSDKDFQRLLPFIKLDEDVEKTIEEPTLSQEKTISPEAKTIESIILDINQAEAEEWQLLHGIGPAYAKRIVNFRNKLGGFHSIDQIAETYGLPDSTFQKIKPKLKKSPLIRSININTATSENLKTHPYISWKQANLIVNYREQHGVFQTTSDLELIKALSADWIQKVKPYLIAE
ncbi:MAG: helix-hairpin-helix domain-containing protein [Bacteroidetes bacterium]|nr:helix-hairpin-helix domain-containing protein [Bacteroidota bacterium]